jgi:hypothetical protein
MNIQETREQYFLTEAKRFDSVSIINQVFPSIRMEETNEPLKSTQQITIITHMTIKTEFVTKWIGFAFVFIVLQIFQLKPNVSKMREDM